jgi:hypothetical protein
MGRRRVSPRRDFMGVAREVLAGARHRDGNRSRGHRLDSECWSASLRGEARHERFHRHTLAALSTLNRAHGHVCRARQVLLSPGLLFAVCADICCDDFIHAVGLLWPPRMSSRRARHATTVGQQRTTGRARRDHCLKRIPPFAGTAQTLARGPAQKPSTQSYATRTSTRCEPPGRLSTSAQGDWRIDEWSCIAGALRGRFPHAAFPNRLEKPRPHRLMNPKLVNELRDYDIASYLGITPVSLSRLRARKAAIKGRRFHRPQSHRRVHPRIR